MIANLRSKDRKIGIAIIGVGRWGSHFVRHFLNHPQTTIIAVVDQNSAHLSACRERTQSGDLAIIWAKEWDEVCKNPTIDAVVVATPASSHYRLITSALELGYHVLAEKPLTLDVSECDRLTRLARQQQRQLFIDHTYLFHPVVTKGASFLRSQALGELYYGYASRTHLAPVREDVDALWDLAIHDIAIFNHWLGETPHFVQAQGQVWLQPHTSFTPQGHLRGLADRIWATLTYPSGFEAQLHLCWSNPDKQRRLCVVGSQGTLIFDEIAVNNPLVFQKGRLEIQDNQFIPVEQEKVIIPIESQEPLKQVCDRFVTAIQTQTPCVLSSGETATQLVKILQGLSLSLQRKGEIVAIE